jgi:hypothetical protein
MGHSNVTLTLSSVLSSAMTAPAALLVSDMQATLGVLAVGS